MSNGKCHHGGCSGEGEYTTQGSQNEDPALTEATTHSSRRRNRTILPERRIQPTRKCKQQRNPPLENKSNDGNSNSDNHHSVPEPIAAPAQPGAFPSKVRIQWPRGNQSSAWTRLDQELSTALTMRLKGSTAKQLSAFCEIVHSLCLEKFGEEVKRKKSDTMKQPNRWACQVMPIEVGCRGFIGRTTTSYLTRLGLTNRARRRATLQLQAAAERASSWIWSKVRKSTTPWQIALLPLFPSLPPPHPHPSFPPFPSLPPPTTSIPFPSSAYRAFRSACSPQWHHPVAEAAGGARVWGTTGSRRNHLTHSGRWLTRVMSRQLLLHVVCIYIIHASNKVKPQ